MHGAAAVACTLNKIMKHSGQITTIKLTRKASKVCRGNSWSRYSLLTSENNDFYINHIADMTRALIVMVN